MKNVLVVSNDNAGRKQALMHRKELHKFLLKRCQKFKFISIDELETTELDDFDTIFAIGGDGTVNKVVKSITVNKAFDKVIGIISCGTANLLASKLGLPSSLNKTLKIIDNNKIKEVDVMNINGNYSILRCGIGYDAEIICKTPQSLKNKFGYFAYFIAGIIFALRLTPKLYNITYDNKVLETAATCLIIANAGNMYKNWFSVSEKCEVDDGLLDVFILKAKNPVIFFLEFLLILFGIKKNNRRALYFKAKNIKIQNNWTVCHIDGEKNNLKKEININLIPEKIKMFCK